MSVGLPEAGQPEAGQPEAGQLEVGRITRPQGIKGEVVVQLVSDRVERVASGSVLLTRAGPLEVLRAYRHGSRSGAEGRRWVVAFAGVETRSQAEALRGTVLEGVPLEDPDVLWVHQLVGSEVIDLQGLSLGRVAGVQANPASDLLVLEDGKLIPARFVVDQRGGEPGGAQLVVDLPVGLLELS